MATFLYRTRDENLRVLVEAQLALGVAFVTVAVPLALDARWTSAAWALQGAALVWLAFRQQRKLALLAGLALQALSGVEYARAVAGRSCGRLADRERLLPRRARARVRGTSSRRGCSIPSASARERIRRCPTGSRRCSRSPCSSWGGGWWFFGGFTEDRSRRSLRTREFAALLVFASATALLAMLARGARGVAAAQLARVDVVAVRRVLRVRRVARARASRRETSVGSRGRSSSPRCSGSCARAKRGSRACAARCTQSAYWLVVALVAWEAHWLVDRAADGVWPEAAVLALAAALMLATLRATRTVAWPFAAHARSLRAGRLRRRARGADARDGGAQRRARPARRRRCRMCRSLNPLELASVLVVFALLRWIARRSARTNRHARRCGRVRPAVAAVAAWFLVTMAVARTVHHWAGVPYDLDSLAASTTFQSALSIVWGLAGLAAMIVGARWLRRASGSSARR